MNNISIKAFEQQLTDLINNVPLPWEVKRLVVKEIYIGVEQASNMAIAQEQASIPKEKNNDESV